jgi:hypothetical protein
MVEFDELKKENTNNLVDLYAVIQETSNQKISISQRQVYDVRTGIYLIVATETAIEISLSSAFMQKTVTVQPYVKRLQPPQKESAYFLRKDAVLVDAKIYFWPQPKTNQPKYA